MCPNTNNLMPIIHQLSVSYMQWFFVFLVSGLDFPGRISAGTKLTCNSFLIQCEVVFILINVHFSLFFPWFQCYALLCCKYLYGIASFLYFKKVGPGGGGDHIYVHTYMYYCIHVFSSIFTNIIYFQTCTSHLPFGGLLGDLTSNLLLSFLLATDALRESSPLSSRLAMKSQQGILSWCLSHFDGRLRKKNQGIWEQDIHCLLATLPNLWTFWMSFLHFPSQCVWIDKQLSANLKVKLRPTVMTCTNYTLQKDGTNKN